MNSKAFPYQREGAAFLTQNVCAGLFDEPGLGKTAQTIFALDRLALTRGVIVCPAAVRNVWPREIAKFSDRPRKVRIGKSSDDLNMWLREKFDILVTSYELATTWKKELGFDLREFTVFDEAHKLKNRQSQRAKAALGQYSDGKHGYARWGAYTWFLTGTPMANDPSDIYTFLRYAGATTLSWSSFCARYFIAKDQYGSRWRPRPECVEELRLKLRGVSLRRTKAQAGVDLPPIWVTTQEIEGDTREITALLREHPGLDRSIIDAIDKGGLKFIDAAHSTTLRRLVGEAKAPVFAKQLIEEIEGGLGKVVVFFAHTRPLEIVEQILEASGVRTVRVDGQTSSDTARGKAVEAFQSDPNVKVFLGNIVAAGEGLTLTAASEIVMLESSWVPAANAQAIMRVHRIGQQRGVHARFISLAASIDETVAKTVADKTAAITAVQGLDNQNTFA